MVTFAQAQERAEEWINGDVPAYQHREVRVREFELGFVVWAEDREGGPVSDGGRQRLVIARDSGDASLWPALPVGEVIRRYEEEYALPDAPAAPRPPERVDLNQTSFLLTPPEWLQEEADRQGPPAAAAASGEHAVPASDGEDSADSIESPATAKLVKPSASARADAGAAAPADARAAGAGAAGAAPAGAMPPADARPAEARPASPAPANAGSAGSTSTGGMPAAAAPADARPAASAPADARPAAPAPADVRPADAGSAGAAPAGAMPPAAAPADARPGTPVPADARPASAAPTPPAAPPAPTPPPAPAFPPPADAVRPMPVDATPWAGTDTNGVGDEEDRSVPLPETVFSPPLAEDAPPPPAAYGYPQDPAAPIPPPPPPPADGPPVSYSSPQSFPPPAPGTAVPGPPPPNASYGYPQGAADIAGAATSKAEPPRGGPQTPPPPGPPGAPAGGYVPTQMVPPPPPPPPGAPGDGVHHAATMLSGPPPGGPGGQAPPPPPPPGTPGEGAQHASTVGPERPSPPPPPGAPGAPGDGVHHAATVLSGPAPQGPGVPPPPGQQAPPAYGYPQPPQPGPSGQPTVGPGYQAVLRYRAPDGSEQQLIRRSAPGTPHPEWQIFHELRGMNVPPDQVLELHTELESCSLPGAYCSRMIQEQWPQARITSIAPYGTDHASRQQGMQQLLAHQGELHQVADGPARPAPVRAPLQPAQPAPPAAPEAIAQELAAAFGPGVFRFDQRAVSRQGVPDVVAHTLVVAGLPTDFGPFFWAQAQPGRPVPTLAELAQERGVRPASDAGSYLVMGSDFGKALCVQYGSANIVAVPVESGPDGAPVPPQFVNSGLPEFARSLALLGRMWRLRYGLNQEQAGRWTVDFQAQLSAIDSAALGSPETWWSVLLEQMWDGLL